MHVSNSSARSREAKSQALYLAAEAVRMPRGSRMRTVPLCSPERAADSRALSIVVGDGSGRGAYMRPQPRGVTTPWFATSLTGF